MPKYGDIQEIQDAYTIVAADAAATNFYARMFAPNEIPWSMQDLVIPPSKGLAKVPVQFEDIRLTVNTTGGLGKQGVVLLLGYMKSDSEIIEWLDRQVQGGLRGTGWWQPKDVMNYPFGWILKPCACIAGDVVLFHARYRRVLP
jgi:hypothetical protein